MSVGYGECSSGASATPTCVGGRSRDLQPASYTQAHTHMHTRAHIKTLGFHARTRMSTRRVDGEITEILDERKWLRTSVIQCAVFSSFKPCRRQHFLFTYRSVLSNSHPVHSFLFFPTYTYLYLSVVLLCPCCSLCLLVLPLYPPPLSLSPLLLSSGCVLEAVGFDAFINSKSVPLRVPTNRMDEWMDRWMDGGSGEKGLEEEGGLNAWVCEGRTVEISRIKVRFKKRQRPRCFCRDSGMK